MTASTCQSKKPTHHRPPSAGAAVTEFRFDDDGSLVPTDADSAFDEIDLRAGTDTNTGTGTDQIEHLVHLASGDVASVVGANAYQPEGPMTTFFATGSSRGTIDSWSVRIASYRTNDIVSIQRSPGQAAGRLTHRPNLIAV